MSVRRSSSLRALLTIATLCFGGLAVTMTQTVVIPIQGRLPDLLHTSVANAGWVVTITLLAGAVTMPISGRLGDALGKRRVIVASAALLVAGSVLCGISDALAWIIAGRTLQGMAMGIVPVGLALMREVTPPHLTTIGVAAMSATLGIGPALGLLASGWLAQTTDWHWLFWISTILGAVLAAATLAFVPPGRDGHGGRVDLLGAIGLAAGLVAVLVGVSKGHEWGWTDPRTLGSVAVGAMVLVAWCPFELRRAEPVVDLRVAAQRPVLLTNLAAVGIGFSGIALGIVLPQLLQVPGELGGLGQTVLQASLWMAPGGLLLLALTPFAAKLLHSIGAKRSLVVGSAIIGCGYVTIFALMDAPWKLLVAMCVGTVGVGISQAALPTLIMEEVLPTEAGSAVGLTLLMRSVGQTTAAAVMATVLSGGIGPQGVPTTDAYHVCFVIGAVAAFAGAVIVAFVPRRPARYLTPAGTSPLIVTRSTRRGPA